MSSKVHRRNLCLACMFQHIESQVSIQSLNSTSTSIRSHNHNGRMPASSPCNIWSQARNDPCCSKRLTRHIQYCLSNSNRFSLVCLRSQLRLGMSWAGAVVGPGSLRKWKWCHYCLPLIALTPTRLHAIKGCSRRLQGLRFLQKKALKRPVLNLKIW